MKKIEKKPLYDAIKCQIDVKIQAGKIYKDLTKKQYRILRNCLLESQKHICCYCEKEINKEDVHIEHFFEQSQEIGQSKTLDYEFNMLASCTKNPPPKKSDETDEEHNQRLIQLTCGHKKTSSYHQNIDVDYPLLLNPMDNISHFFSYVDGNIEASSICNKNEKTQVEYTIKRLNLDNPNLTGRRITAIEQLSMQLYDLLAEEQKKIVANILDDSQDKLTQYYSTMNDNFLYILNL